MSSLFADKFAVAHVRCALRFPSLPLPCPTARPGVSTTPSCQPTRPSRSAISSPSATSTSSSPPRTRPPSSRARTSSWSALSNSASSSTRKRRATHKKCAKHKKSQSSWHLHFKPSLHILLRDFALACSRVSYCAAHLTHFPQIRPTDSPPGRPSERVLGVVPSQAARAPPFGRPGVASEPV